MVMVIFIVLDVNGPSVLNAAVHCALFILSQEVKAVCCEYEREPSGKHSGVWHDSIPK